MGNEDPAYCHALVLNMRNIMYVSTLAHTIHKHHVYVYISTYCP